MDTSELGMTLQGDETFPTLQLLNLIRWCSSIFPLFTYSIAICICHLPMSNSHHYHRLWIYSEIILPNRCMMCPYTIVTYTIHPNVTVSYSLQVSLSICLQKINRFSLYMFPDSQTTLWSLLSNWSSPDSLTLHLPKLTLLYSPSVSVSLPDYCLQVIVHTCSIFTTKYISELAWSFPSRVSLSSPNHHLQVHL